MKPVDMFLTKEAFEQYIKSLREKQAKDYGMTLEEWDQAVATQQVVNHNTQQPTSSYNG